MTCDFEDRCSLFEGCVSPKLKTEGLKKGLDLLVVGDAPKFEDDEVNLAMAVGETNEFLRDSIREAGFDMDNVAFTFVVRCRPIQSKETRWGKTIKVNREPSPAEIKCCKIHTQVEIEVFKPKMVLVLGAIPLKALLNETGITTKRGRVYEVDGIKYIPTLNPESISRDESFKDLIIKDINFAHQVLTEGVPEARPVNYVLCDTDTKLAKLLNKASDAFEAAVDLETSELSPFNKTSQIVCCSFTFEEAESWIVPLYSKYQVLFGKRLDMAKQIMKMIIESPNIAKIGQNFKFDIQWLEVTENIFVTNFVADIMLEHHCLSELNGTSNLEYMVWKFIPEMGGYWDGLEAYKAKHKDCDVEKGGSYRNVPLDILAYYAGGDTDSTLRIHHIIKPLLENL